MKLQVKHYFDASHQLPDSDHLVTKACARLHGHTYAVLVEIADMKELANFDFDQYSTEPPDDDSDVRTINIKTTKAQYDVIMNAINSVKEADDCSDGQALERICADFLGN